MSITKPANVAEARLAIIETIIDVLVDIGEDTPTEELDELEEGMGELADILLDALGLSVTEVDGDVIHCEIILPQVME